MESRCWISFQIATEAVEQQLGISRGAAQKALLEAIKDNALQSQRNENGGLPYVMSVDLKRWLQQKQKPLSPCAGLSSSQSWNL